MKLKALSKMALTRLGGSLSSRSVHAINAVVNYIGVGQWVRAKGYLIENVLDCREQMFDLLGAQLRDRNVLYMEFGVYKGAAILRWSKLLRNPSSSLHGFDSFEGLPETWLPHRPAGYFSTDGAIPQTDDSRVRFFKGWFDQTLPGYVPPPHEVLVINFDADLYSSTVFVLNTLEREIVPGTYLYFDEFNHQSHELRAFDEFCERTGMKFKLLVATRSFEHVVFQRTS